MKSYSCSSDIGSVLIGNESWTFAVPNYGGDGTTRVFIFDSKGEFDGSEIRTNKELDFISSVQGEFGIFEYDCAYHALRSGDMTMKSALCILRGRYGVYRGKFTVVFVRWGD